MANKRLIKNPVFCLNAQDATGWGSSIPVTDYNHIILEFSTANSANVTVKFAGSVSKDSPAFSSAASATNHWDYVDVIDYEDAAHIVGDTGIVLTGTDDLRMLMVNVDALQHFNVQVSARSAGDVTVKVFGVTNA